MDIHVMKNKCLPFIGACALALAITGCGTAPSLNRSERLVTTGAKVKEFEFVYQKTELRNSKTGLPFTYNANGFFDFGQHMVDESASVYAKLSVKVVSGRQIEPNEPIQTIGTKQGTTKVEHVLLVHVTGGGYQSSRHAESASFVFGAKLINLSSGRVVWQASIDTSSWSGKDFMLSGMNKTLYNKEYASQLLTVISEAMKRDEVI